MTVAERIGKARVQVGKNPKEMAVFVRDFKTIQGGGTSSGQYSFRGFYVEPGERINAGWMRSGGEPRQGRHPNGTSHPLYSRTELNERFEALQVKGKLKYVLMSYGTPIAWLEERDYPAHHVFYWVIPQIKYSPRTTAHQSFAYWVAQETGWPVEEILVTS